MHNEWPTLMFRVGNQRSNVIVEANIHVVLAMTMKTAEGKSFYRLLDLKLHRDRMGGMRRGWQIMHTIDETSPLYGIDQEQLTAREAELEISLTGMDDVTMQTVHALHQYSDKQILIGKRLCR